jgi:hypothetical protein
MQKKLFFASLTRKDQNNNRFSCLVFGVVRFISCFCCMVSLMLFLLSCRQTFLVTGAERLRSHLKPLGPLDKRRMLILALLGY